LVAEATNSATIGGELALLPIEVVNGIKYMAEVAQLVEKNIP
jgi:hypothetical protein